MTKLTNRSARSARGNGQKLRLAAKLSTPRYEELVARLGGQAGPDQADGRGTGERADRGDSSPFPKGPLPHPQAARGRFCLGANTSPSEANAYRVSVSGTPSQALRPNSQAYY